MASFSDNIMTFNPHISQLPVDEMTKVGMMKQAQYDAGLERVNQYIADTQGLLDVIHPLQKEYVKSSLSNLHEQLKKVGGADFSNQQLIGQIGGMAAKISKDPTVRNAVLSTANIRKNTTEAEEARKNGKSSPSNEFHLQKGISKFLESEDVNATYNGKFIPYNGDYRKKVFEAVKGLVPSEVAQDFAYETVMGPDGKPKVSNILDVMRRHKVSGIDEGRIKTAIGAALDENDLQQLAIDGEYALKDYGVPQLQAVAVSTFKYNKDNAAKQLAYLKAQRAQTSDIPSQTELNERIAYYEKQLGDPTQKIKGILDQKLEDALEKIKNNPDAARATIHTNNYIDEVANGLAYRKVSDEIHKNPAKDDYWERVKFNFEQQKERNAEAHRNLNDKLSIRKDAREQEEFLQKSIKEAGKPGTYVNAGDPTTEKQESLIHFANYNDELKKTNASILSELGRPTGLGIGTDINAIKGKIEAYKNGDPKGNPANSAERKLMNDYIKNEQILKNNELLLETKKAEAYKEITGAADESVQTKKDLANHNPLVINGVTYTPSEIYNFLKKEKVVKVVNAKGNVMSSTYTVDVNSLNDKERKLYDNIKKRYNPTATNNLNTRDFTLVSGYLSSIEGVKKAHEEINSKVDNLTADKMSTYTGVFRPEQASIPFNNDKTEENFNKSLINIASADLGKKTADIGYNPATVVEWLGAKTTGNIDITTSSFRVGGKQFIKVINSKDPKNPQVIPVTQDWVNSNTALGNTYLNKNLDLSQVLLAGGGTTNLTGKADDAYFKKGEFGNINQFNIPSVTLPVSADFKTLGGSVFATIHLKDKNNQTLDYEFPYPIVISQFTNEYLPKLTDADLIGMFKKQYPNIEQLIKK